MSESDEQPEASVDVSDELLEVRRRRYKEARRAGLSIAEAKLFGDGLEDVGVLRKLVAAGCDPVTIAKIVV